MKGTKAPRLMGIIATAGGLTALLAFPVEQVHSAVKTIKVPGDYPYEETVQIPAPTILESAGVPSPAPFPYSESGLLRLVRLPIHEQHTPVVARSP